MTTKGSNIGNHFVNLPFDNRPSDKECVYLGRLASDFNGRALSDQPARSDHHSDVRWWLWFFFPYESDAVEFENRAVMYQDIMESGN